MRPRLIHCSYHKCLTKYYARVVRTLFNKLLRKLDGEYRHYNSLLASFEREAARYRVASVNNHALDLAALGDFRITRFVRDPRDLIVSGYFYHKRGAEPWCNVVGPTDADYEVVNGTVPPRMPKDESYAAYLTRLDTESGLIEEMVWRTKHYASMLAWPTGDARIAVFRYEDIVGDEVATFEKIFRHYGLSWPVRQLGRVLARRYSAAEQIGANRHIRDPKPSQWKQHFTPRVAAEFDRLYPGLALHLGYQ